MNRADGHSLTPVGDNLLAAIEDEEPIEFVADTSLSRDQYPCYGFTIRNMSDVGPYAPYLLYFDATSFKIDA